jgi:hypothetical protein
LRWLRRARCGYEAPLSRRCGGSVLTCGAVRSPSTTPAQAPWCSLRPPTR